MIRMSSAFLGVGVEEACIILGRSHSREPIQAESAGREFKWTHPFDAFPMVWIGLRLLLAAVSFEQSVENRFRVYFPQSKNA